MKKTLIVGILVLVVLILVLVFMNINQKPVSIVTEKHLSADAYPLYKDLSWSSEQPMTFGTMSGYAVLSVPIKDISDLSKIFLPFENYYTTKLKAAGWTEEKSLAAGGPGSSMTGYKKNNEYLIISYLTDFKGGGENEPVQCPCDITFSIFSGSEK